jgi:stress response protein SCP2
MSTVLSAGQKLKWRDLSSSDTLIARVVIDHPDVDLSVFGLNADRKLEDDRYFVFYNQPQSPNAEIVRDGSAGKTEFKINLASLPANVSRLMFTATSDAQPLAAMKSGFVGLEVSGQEVARFTLSTTGLNAEKALMLLELYLHSGEWRVAAVNQGFNGGLQSLLEYFGGEAVADAAPTPVPAVSPIVSLVKERQRVLLQKAEQSNPALVNLIKQAAVSLEKRGLGEARFRVKLVLDISASMTNEFQTGAVHELVRRALALAVRLDDDGQVETYLFGIKAHRAGTVSLENIEGFVKNLKFSFEGGTQYSPIMQMVRDDCKTEQSTDPALILFITDGATSNPNASVKQMKDAAHEPLFWKFMGIEAGYVNFEFLEKLDDMPGRVVDNADFFKVKSPIRVPDAELFELLVNELDGWSKAARGAGILR